MKIIARKDYADWRHRFECSGCEATLDAECNDVIAMHFPADNDPRGSSPAYWRYYVNCSLCNTQYAMSAAILPVGIRLAAERRAGHTGSDYLDR